MSCHLSLFYQFCLAFKINYFCLCVHNFFYFYLNTMYMIEYCVILLRPIETAKFTTCAAYRTEDYHSSGANDHNFMNSCSCCYIPSCCLDLSRELCHWELVFVFWMLYVRICNYFGHGFQCMQNILNVLNEIEGTNMNHWI